MFIRLREVMPMTVKISGKGSLTVEAALILPMFMTGLLTLVSVIFMSNVCQRIQASLLFEAQELAIGYEDEQKTQVSVVTDEIVGGLSECDLKFIENGKDGIDLTGSCPDDDEYIRLRVSCDLVPLTGFFGALKIPFDRTCLTHAWCGYENGFFPDEEYVYITDDSEVYHRDRNCSHIRLTIKEVTPGDLPDLRNHDGKRYRPCEICHKCPATGKLYITPEGDRYHNSITCSGLKRTVRVVKLSNAGDRRPCSRCGR